MTFLEEGPLAYYVSSVKVANEKADALARFQRAVLKSNAFANENPDRAGQAGLDAIDSPLSLEEATVPYWPTELRLVDLERSNEKLAKMGVIDKPVDLSDVILAP